MKASEWFLDENKGVGYWMKENGWILDEHKGVDIG
jgi:hypothetical protein